MGEKAEAFATFRTPNVSCPKIYIIKNKNRMTRNFFLYLFSLLLPAVMVSCDKEEGFRPSWIAEGADFDSPDHYFYVTFGTMPTLLFTVLS